MMNLEVPKPESISEHSINRMYFRSTMNNQSWSNSRTRKVDYRLGQGHNKAVRIFSSKSYFSVESLLLLLGLTVSLLILPLILPPLPPPPLMILLLPICILAVLMILALKPTNSRQIASHSSYL